MQCFTEANKKCEEHGEGSLTNIKTPLCKAGYKCIGGRCSIDDSSPRCIQLRQRRQEKRNQEVYAEDLWIPECDENGNFQAMQHKKQK
ncbi:thyroglobulin type-1 domain-containing protein [Trichonephila clavipes]|uniref:Thyroglobulin type-1 domain-containing protein n=1 Tax=Trichonephila clavipes TaxID=2585209 RepID=A0A8X6VD79_TRICX|nr:thyroglobulin type-1 domain-containing protein [Trichonephila clavipes]